MGIIQNIQSILAIVAVLIVNIVAVVKGVKAIVQQVKEVKASTEEERAQAQAEAKAAIVETLRPIIFGWVADAEKDLGGGTGKLKSAKVAGWIYEKIPDDLKPLFSAQEIQDMIDDVLRDAQNYWNKNAKAREYIDSGIAAATTLTAEVEAQSIPAGVDVGTFVQAVADGITSAVAKATETAQNGPNAQDVPEPVPGENVAAEPQDAPTEAENGSGDSTQENFS